MTELFIDSFQSPPPVRQPYTTVLSCSVKSEMCHGTSDAKRVCVSIDSDGRSYDNSSSHPTAQALGLDKRQLQIAHRLSAAYRWSKFNYMVESVGGPGLLATKYFANQEIPVAPIPDGKFTMKSSSSIEIVHTRQSILLTFAMDIYRSMDARGSKLVCVNACYARSLHKILCNWNAADTVLPPRLI